MLGGFLKGGFKNLLNKLQGMERGTPDYVPNFFKRGEGANTPAEFLENVFFRRLQKRYTPTAENRLHGTGNSWLRGRGPSEIGDGLKGRLRNEQLVKAEIEDPHSFIDNMRAREGGHKAQATGDMFDAQMKGLEAARKGTPLPENQRVALGIESRSRYLTSLSQIYGSSGAIRANSLDRLAAKIEASPDPLDKLSGAGQQDLEKILKQESNTVLNKIRGRVSKNADASGVMGRHFAVGWDRTSRGIGGGIAHFIGNNPKVVLGAAGVVALGGKADSLAGYMEGGPGYGGYYGFGEDASGGRNNVFQGAKVNMNFEAQTMGLNELTSGRILPQGSMGTAPMMSRSMGRQFQNSAQGLTLGLHKGRHGGY
jgi:hypothetical protein